MLAKQKHSSHDQKQFELDINKSNKDKKPYVSFVTVARNDDHGGDFLPRMIVFITALLEQVKKHNLKAELIIVDWNPPNDKPRLHQALTLTSPSFTEFIKNSQCKIRIIEVTPEIHKQFQNSDKIPLFQMIGKNVGIKRARGQFVVATNVDLLFSDELMKYLASMPLKPQSFYRIDRYDVIGVPYGASVSEQLDHCKHNVIRINRKDGTFTSTSGDLIWITASKRLLQHFRNYVMSNVYYGYSSIKTNVYYGLELMRHLRNDKKNHKPMKLRKMLKPLAKLIFLVAKLTAKLIFLVAKLTAKGITSPISKGIRFIKGRLFPGYPILHTNACGDFTLMARERWFDLRGYPELEIFSWNLDSMILQMAYESGLKEKILKNPMRMYHMEHSSGWTPEQQENLFKRLKDKDIPFLSFDEFKSLSKKMHREKRPIIFNKENWGLGSEVLPEVCIN